MIKLSCDFDWIFTQWEQIRDKHRRDVDGKQSFSALKTNPIIAAKRT